MPRSANVAIQIAAFDKTAQGGRQTALTILLHAFVKKTQKTPQADIDLALKRKREVT